VTVKRSVSWLVCTGIIGTSLFILFYSGKRELHGTLGPEYARSPMDRAVYLAFEAIAPSIMAFSDDVGRPPDGLKWWKDLVDHGFGSDSLRRVRIDAKASSVSPPIWEKDGQLFDHYGNQVLLWIDYMNTGALSMKLVSPGKNRLLESSHTAHAGDDIVYCHNQD